MLIIQCYQLTRTKNPDLVVISITDTNFSVTFRLFNSVVILYKELLRHSVQCYIFKPKASFCLVPGKSKLFSFNYIYQIEHLDPFFASLGFNSRCWRSNLTKDDG